MEDQDLSGEEEISKDLLKSFLAQKEKNTLKAWFLHFDRDRNSRIDKEEFEQGMLSLGFQGNIEQLWQDIDVDESGEITLEEIDSEEASIWSTFRRWCGAHFDNPKDMIRKLKVAAGYRFPNDEVLTEEEFIDGLRNLGWDYSNGFDYILFGALDADGEGVIGVTTLKWLDNEVRRFSQKEHAKRRAARIATKKIHNRTLCRMACKDFKVFLRVQYGPSMRGRRRETDPDIGIIAFFRAWRRELDLDGSMTLNKSELFKTCKLLNWRGDVKRLWQALDHDGSGSTTLEELDAQCAQLIALFQTWAKQQFGDRPSAHLFRVLDRARSRKLKYSVFVQECAANGYVRNAKTVAAALDWQDKKYLIEEDFQFLDMWKPPDWLVATPDEDAAEEFKRCLEAKYRHLLRAWRTVMDKDNSNNCNWHEFVASAKAVGFDTRRVAGAWLALDKDLSGSISLREIDPAGHDILVEFKQWADEEFGGVRSAFRVLDTDHSNELSHREFRGAVRNFGFQGKNVRVLFESLAQGAETGIHMKEVVFLDDWDVTHCEGHEDHEHESSMIVTEAAMTHRGRHGGADEPVGNQLLDYKTDNPGPGAYDIPPAIGAPPTRLFARHSGAWSFTGRPDKHRRTPRSVGPANYNPKDQATSSSKPSYSFGSSARSRTPCMPPRESLISPGPGAYDIRHQSRGPRYTMWPRRGYVLHPSQAAVRAPSRLAAVG